VKLIKGQVAQKELKHCLYILYFLFLDPIVRQAEEDSDGPQDLGDDNNNGPQPQDGRDDGANDATDIVNEDTSRGKKEKR